jgi:iron(III) transport system ATP-binding protein
MKRAAEVEFRSVSKRYGGVTAVDDISFRIEPGTLCTLLGPSGCGKTTTLRLIAGLEMVSSGSISIGGRDVTSAPASERDVSMVFQSYALFPHMNVLENVAYGPTVSGDRAAKDKALDKLRMVGLDAYARRMPSELSGGQQQRVAVARALVLEPQVLLFDEPLSNLDAKLRRRVCEEIRELQQTLGLTVAYVTHDQQEALAVSDQIIVMSNARIAQIGAPRELYEAPRDRFVADFIGDANLVEAELGPHRGSRAPLRLGGLLELEIEHRGVAPGAVRVAIRPESVVLENGNDSPLRGKVGKAAYLGTHMEYTVATPIGQLFVVDRNVSRPIRAGAEVSVTLAGHGVALVPN